MKLPRYIKWICINAVLVLVLMTLLRVAIYFAFVKPLVTGSLLVKAFLMGLWFDTRIVSIVSLIFLILGMIPALNPFERKLGRRVSLSLWTLFVIFFCFFYVIDFANYAYLFQSLSASLINYLYDARISTKMVWQTYHVGWIIAGLIVSVLLLMKLIKTVYNKIEETPKVATKRGKVVWPIVFFLLFALGVFGRLGQYPLRWSDAFTLSNDNAANLALNPFQSFFSTLGFRRSGFDLAEAKKAYPLMEKYLNTNHALTDSLVYDRCADSVQSIQQPNVVLVICESFSAYKSSMYGNPLNTTPYFNELCKNGVFFERCFTPSYGTARGVWATLTGIPDVELLNTTSRNPLAVSQHIIMNDFKGYQKFYFIGGSTSWANIRGVLTHNIDSLHLFEQDDYNAPKIDVWGVSDKNVFLQANKTLSTQQKPFFAVIQTADNHRPYTIPEEDRKSFVVKNVPQDSLKQHGFSTLDEYNAFRYTDYCFEQFMEAAKKEKYFNNTIFVFVGDHGIPGDAGDMFPKAWTDDGLTAEHVPLLFYSPALLKPQRISSIASQIDVLPTIAGICKIPYCNTALGRDLLNKDSSLLRGAFIVDPDKKRIGFINNGLYYSYGLTKGGKEMIKSVVDDKDVTLSDTVRNYYKGMTDAIYQTARYMLFNNKKREGKK
ncbi:MAG: sulfatase-like hydrolase/transferase [Bacteroidota bacterium]|nr:sulfatase-like hydrolase/transferase [Bacteroidota bacterium]